MERKPSCLFMTLPRQNACRRIRRRSRLRIPHTEMGESGRPNGSMNSVTGTRMRRDGSLEHLDRVGEIAGAVEVRLLEHHHGVVRRVGVGLEKREHRVRRVGLEVLSPIAHRSTKSAVDICPTTRWGLSEK